MKWLIAIFAIFVLAACGNPDGDQRLQETPDSRLTTTWKGKPGYEVVESWCIDLTTGQMEWCY